MALKQTNTWVKIMSIGIVFAFMVSGVATISESAAIEENQIYQISSEVDISISSGDITLSGEPISDMPITITANVHGDKTVSGSTTEKTLVFSDDFDDGTLNKWIKSSWNPSGILEVSSAVSHSSPYTLHCQSDPGTNTGPHVLKYLDDCYAHSVTEVMFYLPEKTQSFDKWDIIRVGSSTGTVLGTTNYDFYVALRDDDYSIDIFEYVKDASGVWNYGCLAMDVHELSPNTWHRISLEITETDYYVMVDSQIVAQGPRTVSTPIHHLILGDEGGSGGCWGDSYWDDVKVYSVEETLTDEPGQDATCTVSFYLDSIAPENLIDSVENVFVPADGNAPVSIEWMPVAGDHEIIAVVSDVNPMDRDLSNNVASLPVSVSSPEPEPAFLVIEKVKLSGIDTGFTHTYYEWELLITVTNNGGSNALDVIVHDVLPAELGIMEIVPSVGEATDNSAGTRASLPSPTILPVHATFITWHVGNLVPGQSETLYLKVCTRLNPAGKQEFTSPGLYIINEGAFAVGVDEIYGQEVSAGPAPAITVTIQENEAIPASFSTTLTTGWNLISIPVMPQDCSLDAVLGDALTGGINQAESDKVFRWDPVNWKWLTAYLYEDGDPANTAWLFASEEFTMEPHIGYWVLMRDGRESAVTIQIDGAAPETNSVPLFVGWNLVGYAGQSVGTLQKNTIDNTGLFNSGFTGGTSQSTSDRIFQWDGNGWNVQYMWENGDSDDGVWMGNDLELEPGSGYWIEIREGHEGFIWTIE